MPRGIDEYLAELRRYPSLSLEEQPERVAWHIGDRGQRVPRYDSAVDFSMVNKLIAALGSDSPALLADYLERYDAAALLFHEVTRSLVDKGLAYYRGFVLPHRQLRMPTAEEQGVLARIRERRAAAAEADEDSLQAIPFDVAPDAGLEPKVVLRAFYEVALGQERGPRFGSLVRLVGREGVLGMLAPPPRS